VGLRQGSEQVGEDNGKEQQWKEVRPLRLQLPLYLPRLPAPVLLAVAGEGELVQRRSQLGVSLFSPYDRAEGRLRIPAIKVAICG